MTAIDHTIAQALIAETISSDDLAQLIRETELATAKANEAVAAERVRALDPTNVEPEKARALVADIEFELERLKAALPRLRKRLNEVEAAEYAARWEADLQQVVERRDQLAAELREIYPAFVAKLVDLFHRIEEVDAEVDRVNGSAPPGEYRRLREVELATRDLDGFTARQPSISENLKLPDFVNSSEIVYPPYRPNPLAMTVYQAALAHAQRLGASCNTDWWQAKEAEAAEQRQEAERVEAEREQAESKRAYEKAVLAADEARRTGSSS